MKDKRGFTLVEMLGVLIILIIIFMIAFPTITRVLKNTEEGLSASEKQIVIDATKDLLSAKKDIYIPNDDNTYCITFETLMNQGKLTENQIENIRENYNTIEVTYKDRKPSYKVLSDECSEVIKDAHLEIIGKANITLELASDGSVTTYVEEGLKFINDGEEIILDFTLDNLYPDLSVTITSLKTGNVTSYLPETILDTYVIKYEYMAEDGKMYYAERTVKIGDTEAPVIVVNPEDVTLAITNTTYDVRNGVTVTDNSGVTPTLTVSTNLNLGKAGKYVINYTATDKSGNKAYAKRNVVITEDNILVQVELLGDKKIEVEQYATFTDPGAKATGSDGTDYTSSIVKTTRFGSYVESAVDTSKLGLHYITYSVTKDGVTSSETRTVEVVEGTMGVTLSLNSVVPGSVSVTTNVTDTTATNLVYKYYYKLSEDDIYTYDTTFTMDTSLTGYSSEYTYTIPDYGIYDFKVVVIADGIKSGYDIKTANMNPVNLNVTLTAVPMGAATDMYLFTNVNEERSNLNYTYYYKLSTETEWTLAGDGLDLEPDYYSTEDDIPEEFDNSVSIFLSSGFVSYDFKVVVSDGGFASGEAYTSEENYCFVAGTKVDTENGLVNIENIKVGDKVYAVDVDSGIKELKPVTRTITSYVSELYHIYVGDEIIKASPKHQFYIIDKGWVRAKDLKAGDKVISGNEPKAISKVKYESLNKALPVYNLEVDGVHTYLVTKYSILVHNMNMSIQSD